MARRTPPQRPGAESPLGYRPVAGRRYENVYTGEVISRRQYERRIGQPLPPRARTPKPAAEGAPAGRERHQEWTHKSEGLENDRRGVGEYDQLGGNGSAKESEWQRRPLGKTYKKDVRKFLLEKYQPEDWIQLAFGGEYKEQSPERGPQSGKVTARRKRGWLAQVILVRTALHYLKESADLVEFAARVLGERVYEAIYAVAVRRAAP